MVKKYMILHVLSGEYLKVYTKRDYAGKYTDLTLTSMKQLPAEISYYNIDFILPAIITDFTDETNVIEYWHDKKEYTKFKTKQLADDIINIFLDFIENSSYTENIILYRNISKSEFEIVEI